MKRDVLLTEFHKEGVLPTREYGWEDCCIIDEYDSLAIDSAGHTLFLSQPIGGLEHCEELLLQAFAAGHSVVDEESLEKVAEELEKRLKDGLIDLPTHLTTFAHDRLQRWLRSVVLARSLQKDSDFLIRSVADEVSGQRPVAVDVDSGIEQYSLRWSDGVHQFLGLMYDSVMDSETLRAVYLATGTFLSRVKDVFGVTGTLGGDDERDFLKEEHKMRLLDIPTRKPQRYLQLPPLVKCDAGSWTQEGHVGRGVKRFRYR